MVKVQVEVSEEDNKKYVEVFDKVSMSKAKAISFCMSKIMELEPDDIIDLFLDRKSVKEVVKLDQILFTDDAQTMGTKLTKFLEKCYESKICVRKITIEVDKPTIAEIYTL